MCIYKRDNIQLYSEVEEFHPHKVVDENVICQRGYMSPTLPGRTLAMNIIGRKSEKHQCFSTTTTTKTTMVFLAERQSDLEIKGVIIWMH